MSSIHGEVVVKFHYSQYFIVGKQIFLFGSPVSVGRSQEDREWRLSVDEKAGRMIEKHLQFSIDNRFSSYSLFTT